MKERIWNCMDKVSIVTISLNSVKVIEKTILSIINQTYKNIEYIVIDGGSTDGTIDVICKYRRFITYFVSEPDEGIYYAMNKGIEAATGKWINFINAGDYFYKNDSMERIICSIPDNQDYDVVYGYIVHSFNYGEYIRKRIPLSSFSYCMPLGHPSSIVKTEIMKRFKFECRYHIAADYNFFYQLYTNGYSFYSSDVIVAVFESSEGISNSFKYAISTLKETAIINGSYGSWGYYKTSWALWIKSKLKRILYYLSSENVKTFLKWKRDHHSEFIPLSDFISKRNIDA